MLVETLKGVITVTNGIIWELCRLYIEQSRDLNGEMIE